MKLWDIRLTEPQYLWTLVLPGVLVLWYAVSKRHPNITWSSQRVMRRVMVSGKGVLRHITAFVFLLVMVLASVAASRPAYATSVQEERSAIILVLDVSTSMTAVDIAPNRLDAAKAAASTMIKEAPASLNIGLVTLADHAEMVLLPTQNRQDLLDAVRDLKSQGGGTASGEGVIEAVETLEAVSGFGSSEQLPARIVLVSDGKEEIQENERSLAVAAEEAVEAGYPVFTVDYGTQDGEINGQPIRNDPEALQAIAERTGGASYQAGSTVELQEALQNIPGAIQEKTIETVLPEWFTVAALAFLVLLTFGFVAFNRS